MNHYLDLYIQKAIENEPTTFEKELASDVVQQARNRMYGANPESFQTQMEVAESLSKHIVPTSIEPKEVRIIKTITCRSSATNWWLALIAFLLFMILCNQQ